MSLHARFHIQCHKYEAALLLRGPGSIRSVRDGALLLRGPRSLRSSEFTPSRKSDYATRRQCVVLLVSHAGCRQARVWFCSTNAGVVTARKRDVVCELLYRRYAFFAIARPSIGALRVRVALAVQSISDGRRSRSGQ